MAGLPKGLLKSLIKEGYDPPEAMKEAWRIVGVQKKRYAARMSHGGEYPLGYKGRKNPALRFKDLKEGDAFIFESEETMPFSGMALGPWIKFDNRTYYKSKALSPGQIRHLIKVGSINVKVIKTGEIVNPKISFSEWLTSVEREFDSAGVHPKWSGFTARKFYKVYSPKKAAEVLILESKRGKNPKQSKHKTSKGIFYFPTFQAARKYAQDHNHPTNRIIEYQKGWAIQLRVSGPYVGKNPVKKNPIAVFNPGGGTLIYGRVLELRAVKTSGKHRGERYRHTFGAHVQAFGLSSGEVLLKSNNGARLWKSI